MAALVQSYPQQSSTVTMLQTRPSSASGMLQTSQNQLHHPYPPNSHAQRNSFHGIQNSMVVSNYRGHTAVVPVPPYAFSSTPNLNTTGSRTQSVPHLRADQRTSSAPIVPTTQHRAANSVSTTTSSSSGSSSLSQISGSKDDSALVATARVVSGTARPQSIVAAPSGSTHTPSTPQQPVKPIPDRYRRNNNRRAESSSSGIQSSPSNSATDSPSSGSVVQFNGSDPSLPSISMNSFPSFSLDMPQFASFDSNPIKPPGAGVDNMPSSSQATQERPQGYRRRSNTHDASDAKAPSHGFLQQGTRQVSSANGRIDHQQNPSAALSKPNSSHGRNGSSESAYSARSGHSRPDSATKRDTSLSMATGNPTPFTSSQPAPESPITEQHQTRQDVPRLVNIPPRVSSTDAAKRINSSPLSKPVTMGAESPPITRGSFASTVNAALQQPPRPTYAQVASDRTASPAAQQLAALNDKEEKKSKTSRLRRAFSFGSAAELRRASAENSAVNNSVDRSRMRKEKYQDEQDAEQARVAQQQEAGGIGSGIYSGQGNIFSGSTDNLSISSTASSASVMIRKMGKGMKKSTRSLVGLFRPKSVIGVPAADSALPQVSQAQVSMVTVEAEREKVNVNSSPLDHSGGGSGYPKLERNSVDTANANLVATERLGSSGTENSTRKSIVGGEKERAEVLAAVKKGILKRSGTDSGNSSPVIKALDSKTTNFQLPQVPHVNESPNSSAPSTPNEEQHGHRTTGSVTLGGEDYFMSALRFQGSKSLPGTPGTNSKRNATFSPRIQFHDTWPSGEYDRRSELATCNRLTPMLAQQIKEELNTFKMEMEVHENSKIYTHFF